MLRRDFLKGSGLGLLALGGCNLGNEPRPRDERGVGNSPIQPGDWASLRAAFELEADWVHLAGLLLASHPRPVGDRLERIRRELDENPGLALIGQVRRGDDEVRASAARYLGAGPEEVALTFNTTTGLGLVYGGVQVRADQELLTTEHGYHVTHDALRFRAQRAGASVRRVRLYEHGEEAEPDVMLDRLLAEVREETRVVALTWVHSSTGVKIPLARMGARIQAINADRAPEDQAIVVVDAVHALGVEVVDLGALDCDVLVAGTHKWLLGPRGTGVVWAHPRVQAQITPLLPTFSPHAGWGGRMSPGGFHAYEHRWALPEAFALHDRLGPAAIEQRIHGLARRLKEGLEALPGVRLRTPMNEQASAGVVCFTLEGWAPGAVVDGLRQRRVIASTTPYSPSFARFSPGLMNDEDDVDRAVEAVRDLG